MSNDSTPQTSESSPYFQNKNNKIEEYEKNLILSISQLLEEIIKKNKRKKYKILKDSFYSEIVPKITISDYIFRIIKYTKINISTLILSVTSITSFMRKTRNFLSINNIHKLLIVSCFLNAKFNEDYTFSSKFYAKVGGVSINEIDTLEYAFLILIDFKLYVSEELFQKYSDYIQNTNLNEI